MFFFLMRVSKFYFFNRSCCIMFNLFLSKNSFLKIRYGFGCSFFVIPNFIQFKIFCNLCRISFFNLNFIVEKFVSFVFFNTIFILNFFLNVFCIREVHLWKSNFNIFFSKFSMFIDELKAKGYSIKFWIFKSVKLLGLRLGYSFTWKFFISKNVQIRLVKGRVLAICSVYSDLLSHFCRQLFFLRVCSPYTMNGLSLDSEMLNFKIKRR